MDSLNESKAIAEELPSFTGRFSNWIKTPGFRKYFMNTGWLMLGRIINILTSFFAIAYVARNLGPTNYGQLSYAVSFVGLFSAFYGLGLDQILFRDLVKYPEKRNEYLGSSFVLKIVAGILSSIVCIIFAVTSSPDDVSLWLIVILSTTFAFNALSVINFEFQAAVQSKYLSIMSVSVSLTLNILKIATVAMNKGVIYLALILAIEPILYAILYIYFRQKKFGSISNWTFKRETAFSLLKDSWPVILASAFSFIYIRIDQVLIKNLIDTSSVGIYDAAVRIAEAWSFVPSIIASSVFPAIINAKKHSEESYRQRLQRLILLLAGIAIFVAIPVTILAPFIINLIYGPLFADSAKILQIYIWGGFGLSIGVVANFYMVTENRRVLMLISSLATMSANVILNLLLIPHYGIVGSAWATFISYLLLGTPLLFLLRRHRI